MLTIHEILETIKMVQDENLDIRTITMGISLRDCSHPDVETACSNIYEKITRLASRLEEVGEDIAREYGIPIVNKRISVTPISLVAEASQTSDYLPFAQALDRAAQAAGVNFIGGFSALVHKGFSQGDSKLINSIPETLSATERVCSSVNVATTRAGINMDAVCQMGQVIKETARLTAKEDALGCAKLVVFANVPDLPMFPRTTPLWPGLFTESGNRNVSLMLGSAARGW